MLWMIGVYTVKMLKAHSTVTFNTCGIQHKQMRSLYSSQIGNYKAHLFQRADISHISKMLELTSWQRHNTKAERDSMNGHARRFVRTSLAKLLINTNNNNVALL